MLVSYEHFYLLCSFFGTHIYKFELIEAENEIPLLRGLHGFQSCKTVQCEEIPRHNRFIVYIDPIIRKMVNVFVPNMLNSLSTGHSSSMCFRLLTFFEISSF